VLAQFFRPEDCENALASHTLIGMLHERSLADLGALGLSAGWPEEVVVLQERARPDKPRTAVSALLMLVFAATAAFNLRRATRRQRS
jgi:hypothetical protein